MRRTLDAVCEALQDNCPLTPKQYKTVCEAIEQLLAAEGFELPDVNAARHPPKRERKAQRRTVH